MFAARASRVLPREPSTSAFAETERRAYLAEYQSSGDVGE